MSPDLLLTIVKTEQKPPLSFVHKVELSKISWNVNDFGAFAGSSLLVSFFYLQQVVILRASADSDMQSDTTVCSGMSTEVSSFEISRSISCSPWSY